MNKNQILTYTISGLIIGLTLGVGFGYYFKLSQTQFINDLIVDLNQQISNLDSQVQNIQENLTNQNEEITTHLTEIERLELLVEDLEKRIPPLDNKAPDFVVQCSDGSLFKVSDHNTSIILIDFISTTCFSCTVQTSHLKTIQEKYGDKVVILSVITNTLSDNEFNNFLSNVNAPWKWTRDSQQITELFNVEMTPSTFLLDKMGYIWTNNVGVIDANLLEKEIEQMKTYWGTSEPPSYFESILVHDAKLLTDSDPDLVLLDVRTQKEYEEDHLQMAINIPVQELSDRLDELEFDKRIIVYCHSGVRSAQASQILVDNGHTDIYNMEGGILAWKNEKNPTINSQTT